MHKFHTFVYLVALLLILAASALAQAQQPIVIELFTSEGCSSCPPADALLDALSQRRVEKGIPLILLGEHVEYWDGLGWRDRFSAPTFTQRQYAYVRSLNLATAYTPQVVIDGRLQAVGSNGSAMQRLIADATRTPKPVEVSLAFTDTAQLRVLAVAPSNKKLDVWLAITEDNLTTDVKGGENGGRVLHHAAVVRELRAIGTMSGGRFEKVIKLQEPSHWKPNDLRAVVLVQEPNAGAILGAGEIRLAGATPLQPGR